MVAKILRSTSFLITQARLDAEFFGKFFYRDSFTDRDFPVNWRRRSFLTLRRRAELTVELAFHVPLAIDFGGGTGLRLVTATGFGRRRSGRFNAAQAAKSGGACGRPPRICGDRAKALQESGTAGRAGWPGRKVRGKSARRVAVCPGRGAPGRGWPGAGGGPGRLC